MTLTIVYQNKEHLLKKVEHDEDIPQDASFIWYDFEGANEEERLIFEKHFELNELTIEEVINKKSRPKYKKFPTYEYLVFQKIEKSTFEAETINILMKDNVLITYHDEDNEPLDELDAVAQELEENAPDTLTPHTATLMLLDKIVDFYTEIVEEIETKVLEFEKGHANDRMKNYIMNDIFELRSEMIKTKGIIVPMSELIDEIENEDTLIQTEHDHYYIHHIRDHVIKQQNMIKNAHELTDEIRSNYESFNNYRMNRVMQILTLVSTVFLPLTLIAGIYGMNFEYMPELKWHYGYFIVLFIMLSIMIGCMIYFKKKKWY
ncbi:magnesium/cobalt transporter CorA [Macrococcoides caseolyticum]|uniref:magnesium/cobalt transporter CorA n=1 Tax=Macrococcoides caseolyticum TaxID=69966 RepID=UPI0012FF487A|nr:magnesium/cobalt transporter CorA [Macrococcus caseolyticus]